MNLKNFFLLSYGGLILLLGLSSCVKDVTMDAKERPEVAISCILSDDPVQELHIVYTKGASINEAPPVMEADAVLKDLTSGETRSFEREEDGVWRMDYTAEPTHTYRLEVIVPGYEQLYSECVFPDKVQVFLQRLYWLENKVISPTGYAWGPNLVGDDVQTYWLDGDNLPCGETFFGVASLNNPVWIYAMCFDSLTGKRVIAEEICTDYPSADSFNLTGKVYIPPQWEEPIPYQVKPKYEALLALTHTKALYPWLDGKPMHKKYIRLDYKDPNTFYDENGLFRPIGIGVSGDFHGKFNCSNFIKPHYYADRGYVQDLADNEGYIVWTAVSEELDKYLKEAYNTLIILSSADLTTIYLRDNLQHTNIIRADGSNGLGIFGGMIERKYQWSSEGTYIDYDRSNEPSSFNDCVIMLPQRGQSP